MSDQIAKMIGYVVTLLTGLFGGAGGVIWYINNRARDRVEARQEHYDRVVDRNSSLYEKVDDQHDKIVEQGEIIENLRGKVGEERQKRYEKEGEIARLEGKLDKLKAQLEAHRTSECPSTSEVS